MITTDWTQYLLPDGRQKPTTFEVADDLGPQLAEINAVGARLEVEMLTTGQVSVTIVDPQIEEDFDIEIISNGPPVPKAIDKMIRRFSLDDFNKQREAAETEGE